MSGLAARRAALTALRAVEDDGAYSNLVVPDAVGVLPEVRDRAFASHLAYDTLRWHGTLVWALELVLDRPLDAVEAPLARVLRLGALQLLRSAVPAHAAISTSVDLARTAVPRSRSEGAARFANGVLRALARTELSYPDDPAERLALETAHPVWQIAEVRDQLGDEAESALHADNDPPGLTLRALGDRDGLVTELQAQGHEADAGTWAPEAIRVPGADPRALAAVSEGRAVPQDEASMFVVHSMGVRPGDRTLDLCAGPGGKSTHLAQLGADVVSIELHPHRAELIRSLAERLGVRVDVVLGDARDVDVGDGYDQVLVDAPCTDLGTGRRRPEVRWRRTPTDVAALSELQRELLLAGASRVAPGGRLTYSVCTWTGPETDGVVEVIADRPGWTQRSRRQLWPHRDATDGMFVASFQRDE
ncbi:MAG: hypothetical protein KY469_12945 [Actinobacteria bacterium]|nr:hypothetical protein [Actinomycetota bacterium]